MDIYKFKTSFQEYLTNDYDDYRITEVIGDALDQLINKEGFDKVMVLSAMLSAVPAAMLYDHDNANMDEVVEMVEDIESFSKRVSTVINETWPEEMRNQG